jgi:hypothetical protein
MADNGSGQNPRPVTVFISIHDPPPPAIALLLVVSLRKYICHTMTTSEIILYMYILKKHVFLNDDNH